MRIAGIDMKSRCCTLKVSVIVTHSLDVSLSCYILIINSPSQSCYVAWHRTPFHQLLHKWCGWRVKRGTLDSKKLGGGDTTRPMLEPWKGLWLESCRFFQIRSSLLHVSQTFQWQIHPCKHLSAQRHSWQNTLASVEMGVWEGACVRLECLKQEERLCRMYLKLNVRRRIQQMVGYPLVEIGIYSQFPPCGAWAWTL